MKKILLFGAAALIAASAAAQELVYEIDYSQTNWDFYVMGYAPEVVDGVLVSENPLNEEGGPAWYQYFIADHFQTVAGESYTAVITCKASEESTMNLNLGWGWGEGEQQGHNITMSTDWTDVKQKYENVGAPAEGSSSNLVLQPGTCMAKIEIKSVKLYLGDAPESGDTPDDPAKKEWQSIITNGNANDGVSANILARVDGVDGEAAVVANPDGEGKVFEAPIVANPDPGVNDANNGEWSGVSDWSSQMFIMFDEALEEGTDLKVSFEYYCTDNRTVQSQAHGAPGSYHHWQFIGNLEAKPEWQKLEWAGTISAEQAGQDGCKSIAFNLSTTEQAGTFYLSNVEVEAFLPVVETAVEQINVVSVAGVYNLQGVKVANSLDEVVAPGLYITNGKKVIKK